MPFEFGWEANDPLSTMPAVNRVPPSKLKGNQSSMYGYIYIIHFISTIVNSLVRTKKSPLYKAVFRRNSSWVETGRLFWRYSATGLI